MDLTDPRDRNALHTLHDMIVIAVMAIVCGADSWVQVQLWGECRLGPQLSLATHAAVKMRWP
ncbi:MAG TPA: transposase family protein [Tepidisphaeraceae bacterium]|nr:transposase family protein [Tepidisphaeraceae bacterium]